MAELDLRKLNEAHANNDSGAIETLTEAANVSLKARLDAAWQQSDVEVHIRLDGAELRILVRADAPAYSTVAERSDGLKSFVALTAFAHSLAQETRPLVLLIDEAEQHLHYDAQADLIRMLERQSVASQVIYTTHSAGCLPSDLGTGVRAVTPLSGHGRSVIANSLWQSGPGFAPLVMALGASAAAFAPTRYAVIGEGATEMLLLPSMIREAIGSTDRLDYQVAAGLAEVGNGDLRDLELEAPRVVYLVDGDAGGQAHATRLKASGVPAHRIVSLGGATPGLTLEDLLRDDVYIAALNEILRQGGCEQAMTKSAFALNPVKDVAIEMWCQSHSAPYPRKARVASAILSLESDAILTRPAVAVLKRVHSDILDALDLSPKRNAIRSKRQTSKK
jgi:predicted ATP-dependent endonuclease of OLD family